MNEHGSAEFQMKVIRTFVRSFAARHKAHTDLYPGQVITLVDSPREYQKGHEYLILVSEKDSRFRIQNSCGSSSSEEIFLGLVPGFKCPARLLWTVSDVEARLMQPSVCPEQGYQTSDPPKGPFGPPEVLTLEDLGPHERPRPSLGALWLGIALASITFVFVRQRRLAKLVSIQRP